MMSKPTKQHTFGSARHMTDSEKEFRNKINMEFARRDDCLDKMVPSDLRQLLGEKEQLQAKNEALVARVARLKEALSHAMQCWQYDGIAEEHGAVAMECEARLNETESESLAHIQAESVLRFAAKILVKQKIDVIDIAKAEADLIRQQDKDHD